MVLGYFVDHRLDFVTNQKMSPFFILIDSAVSHRGQQGRLVGKSPPSRSIRSNLSDTQEEFPDRNDSHAVLFTLTLNIKEICVYRFIGEFFFEF